MPGNMKDGLQNTIVRDPFISDDVDQLPPEAFMPVSIFECSHRCKIIALLNICSLLFFL